MKYCDHENLYAYGICVTPGIHKQKPQKGQIENVLCIGGTLHGHNLPLHQLKPGKRFIVSEQSFRMQNIDSHRVVFELSMTKKKNEEQN